MTLAAPLCPPRGVVDPAGVARKESALLEVLRRSPEGLRAAEVWRASKELRSATADRLRRLMRRGEVEKVGSVWRLARDDQDEPEPQPVDPRALGPEPGAQSRWVKPLSAYDRKETTVVEGLRYG
jgi:hypothetical protein